MLEYFTEALVLDNKDNRNELDALAVLYTRDFGKISAKVKSAKKISSKLNGHLQPLNFIDVRLIVKNNFQVIDALKKEPGIGDSRLKIGQFKKIINIVNFIDEMVFELQPEPRLWLALQKIFDIGNNFDESVIYRSLLKILGFDPAFAKCHVCDNQLVAYFDKTDHIFFCQECGKNQFDDHRFSLVKLTQ